MHSVEALVRWRHPTRGLLLPDQFLPAAEDAGLMRPLAARVLDMALTQLRSWRDDGVMVTVAVNLSTTNLLDLGLVASIARLLRTHDLPPESLILEITESTLTTDSQRARNTVAALRRLGTRLSLDDYGTGWSSLARLQDLSVDELKLDQVFVARLALDPRSIAIVRSTVALAHSLGADLVAEGVEDDATLRALRQYGCNITQGNVHSPPLPPAEIQRWLTARCSTLDDSLTGTATTTRKRNVGHTSYVDRRTRGQIVPLPRDALDQMPARVVLERIPVPSLAVARDGQILFANQAFAEMVGHSTDALLSMAFSQLFWLVPTDESPVSVVRKYANQLVELMHADGSLVRARMSKSALMRDDDPLALATFHDLTEQLWNQGR